MCGQEERVNSQMSVMPSTVVLAELSSFSFRACPVLVVENF
jgi:hypothetical protein